MQTFSPTKHRQRFSRVTLEADTRSKQGPRKLLLGWTRLLLDLRPCRRVLLTPHSQRNRHVLFVSFLCDVFTRHVSRQRGVRPPHRAAESGQAAHVRTCEDWKHASFFVRTPIPRAIGLVWFGKNISTHVFRKKNLTYMKH